MGSGGIIAVLAIILLSTSIHAQSEQQILINLVNEYRNQYNLTTVPTSYWLTATAMLHTIDHRDNGPPAGYGCQSDHSWSGDSTLFTGPCCYSATNWQCMGLKPEQISGGAFTGIGYEDWVQASSPQAALAAWQASPEHNEVILNLEGWAGSKWKAIGAGVCGGYYGLWFSQSPDPNPDANIDMLTCSMTVNGPIPNPVTGSTGSASAASVTPSITASPSYSASPSHSITSSPSLSGTPSPSLSSTLSHSTPSLSPSTPSLSPSPKSTANVVYPKLWMGGLTATDNSWTTVTMNQNFNNPVIVCSLYYALPQNPLVVRMRNVISGGNSFQISVSGTMAGTADIDCIAVESGTYTAAANGITIEANVVTSTVTNSKSDWTTGTPITFANKYTNPVILGQVMTSNDPNWSVFYARGSTSPTSYIETDATSCVIGKQVGEDPDTTRANEQLGYIVIEAGSGLWGSTRQYEAIMGPGSVYGVSNSPAYTYSRSGISPAAGVNTVNSVVGPAGGYSIFYGNRNTAYANQDVGLAIDEYAVGDATRYHECAESVGVLLFQ
jgi:hypothetical protein